MSNAKLVEKILNVKNSKRFEALPAELTLLAMNA